MQKIKVILAVVGNAKAASFAMVLLLVLLWQPAFGKDKASKTPKYDSKPFDLSLSQLPARYTGHNPVAVYAKAKNGLVAKSEFETNDEYAARVKSATESLGLYAFARLNNSDNIDEYAEEINYDAEAEAFTITIPLYSESNMVVFDTRYSEGKGSYIGQNAFGAKVRVSKRDATIYYVSFSTNLDEFSKISLKVPMPRDKAKQLKDSIKVLYIGSPIQVKRDTGHWTPEVKDPYDTNATFYTLEMQLKQIWIYNFMTGQVLYKEDNIKRVEVKGGLWRLLNRSNDSP